MTTVGQALVQGLAARGVDLVFGIPGVHTVELYRGLAGSGIRHVTARHEAGATFMADGYARVTGRPGVAFVITGPGLTNALTAMAQARADSVPVLVISGVNRRDSLGRGLGLLHELPDQAGLISRLCPSFRIDGPGDLDTVLTRAFAALTSARPGPVHIEVPTDVMPLPCAAPGPLPPRAAPAEPDPDAIAEAAARLNRATRLLILAGGGARQAQAALARLARLVDAPVVQTVNARGLMWQSPLSVAASPSLQAVRDLMGDADLVLAVGTELGPTDYDMYVRGGLPDLSDTIRIDICPDQLARHPCALTVQADAGAALTALADLVPSRAPADGATRAARTMAAAWMELATLSPAMPHQLAMVTAIRDTLPGGIIVGDSTQPVYAANLVYDHDRAGGWFNAATGYGTLGYAPGAAIGAALAAPGTPVTCLIGDGGLAFSAGELRTALDEGLPVTFLIWNSDSYQEIADAMQAVQAPVIGCHPSALRMEPFAAACGLPFASVASDPAALAAALAKPCNGPRLIEVRALPTA